MDAEQLSKMLELSRSRPKVLFTDTHILEQETESEDDEIHELPNGDRVVTHVYVVRELRRTVTIREFDPSKSYGDAVTEFMMDKEDDEEQTRKD